MQKNRIVFLALLISTQLFAEDIKLKTTIESFNFENSKKKNSGVRAGVHIGYHRDNNLWEVFYEKTITDTFKPPLTKDLKIDKISIKATHKYDDYQAFYLSYININDNLIKEVDGGDIYGIGYKNGGLDIVQYWSDYSNFDVYQSDISYLLKKKFDAFMGSAKLIGKYIHLVDQESNPLSSNAKDDYFTVGAKIHLVYPEFYVGAGAFFGERVFAVMQDGFRVQHHAMEFDKTYRMGVGKKWGKLDLKAMYVYQEATELPILNENVKVKNIILQMKYSY